MRTTTVRAPDGVAVAVHDFGGQGPDLLLAHATGFNGMSFAPLARQLQDFFRCVALDERGHGDSGLSLDGRFDWSGFAWDVLGAIDGLGLDSSFGFGHSCGATALLLAEQWRPGTFTALYCYEPILFPPASPTSADEADKKDPTPANPLAEGARRRREVFPSRDEAYRQYASKPPLNVLDAEALRSYVDHGFSDLPGGGVQLKCRGENEARVYEMAPFSGAWDRLAQIGCTVAVAHGEVTDTFPPDFARAVADALPAGKLEVLAGLGHFGPLEDPTALALAVRRVLADPGSNLGRPRGVVQSIPLGDD